ncbi:MAG TPA: LysR family transcriptional regulator [Burkholderiaceae bacterium]|nr:LysR family transcriptional regulator [Burkholderiaceae bacterium]
MNLTTRQLKAFVVVARLASFTRAAEQVHMTQAGLSLMIREMEEQLTCRLFERTTRTVSLTAAGRSFLPVVQRLLADLDGATREAVRLTQDADRTLTVAATPLVCASILPDVMASLRQTHPDLSVTVRDVDRAGIVSMVESSEVDVGLGVLLEEKSSLVRQVLRTVGLVLVSPAARAAGAAARAPATWQALQGQPMLALPADNAVQEFVDKRLSLQGVDTDLRARFRHLHTLIAMVEAGYGQAVLPSFASHAAKRYRVRVRPMAPADSQLDFYAITRRGASPGEAIKPFFQTFTAQLAAADPSRGLRRRTDSRAK